MAALQEKLILPSLSYDKDIFLNKKIQMTLLSSHLAKLYENINNERSSIFPINEYISKKQEIDLVYQHPEIRSQANIKVRDEYNNLQLDFINKWYENFVFQSLCMSSLAEHYYMNALRIPNNIEEEFNQFKEVIKTQYNQILNDNQLQVNSILIKTFTKNFVKSIGISLRDALHYSEIISESLSLVLSNNYQMIFFFGNEIISIVDLIQRLFKEQRDKSEEQLMLIQILFNIALGFKSLYGLLVTIKLIQCSNLEEKHLFNMKSLKKMNKIAYESNNIPLLDINHISSSSDSIESQELTFVKATAALASNDVLLIHNNSFGLIKFIIVQNKDLCFKIINSCTDQALIHNINKTCSLFVYREVFGFLFSFNHFKQEDGLQKLFTLFNTISLRQFDNDQITLSYDELTRKILFANEPVVLYNEHYSKFIKTQETVPSIKKSVELNYSSENVAIGFEDHYLYIIHPINYLNNNVDKKNNIFIYALDIFNINYNQEIKTIHFTYHQTHVFNWKDHDKSKYQIQDIFTKNKTLNRFIIVNGQIISPDGNHILNTKADVTNQSKPIINIDIKMNITYKDIGLIMSFKGNALFLYLNEQKKETSNQLYYNYYTSSSYEKENELFNTTSLLPSKDKIQSNTSDDDVLEELFMTNLFNNQPKEDPVERTDNQSEGTTKMLLQILCNCIDYRQYMNFSSNNIEHCIKSPYILSLDYSTMMIFLDLIKQNYSNEIKLRLISKLFLNQLCQMIYKKTNACIIFNSQLKNEEYLQELLQIRNSITTHTKSAQILSVILMKLLQVSKISSEVYNKILISILPNLTSNPSINCLISNQVLICEFFELMIYSKEQCNQITSNKELFECFCIILTVLLEAEQSSRSNVDCILIIKKVMNYILTIFSLLLATQHINSKFNRLVYLLLAHIKSNTSFLVKQSSSFSISLFHFVLMIIIPNFNSLQNSFAFQNISMLIEVIFSLSALKPVILLEPSKRLDIVFDNFSSFEDISKSFLFKYPSSYLPKGNDIKDKIYIEAIVIRKEPLTEKTMILEVKSTKSNQIFSTIQFEGISSTNTYEIEVDLYSGVDICFYPIIPNTLIKIRISNYEFYSKEIDFVLQPSVELLNMMLRRLTFYASDINTDSKLFNLFSTRLFSGGIMNRFSKHAKNGDLEAFVRNIRDSSEYYSNYLYKSFTNLKEEKNITIGEKNGGQTFKNKLDELGNNSEFNSILNQFNLQLTIIIKGDIPDKLVKYAFYIILHHENILNEMLSANIDGSRKMLFSIYKECSDIRMVYKEIKDKLIQEDKDVAQGFEEIFEKMNFIYNLHPERKSSLLQSDLNHKRRDSITNTVSPSTQIIKDHLINITQIIKNTLFTIDNIIDGFEEINTKAKFREIVIKILIDLIIKIPDTEVVCNLLTSFYCSFISMDKKIPSIYLSLKSINEKTVENITSAFHKLLSVLMNKLDSGKLSKFEQCIMLNCLIWKIRKRNFPFFESNHLFNLLENEDYLKNANYFLYFIPPTPESQSKCLFENYSELRPIDDCHLGKLLTDIFSYYTHRIVKLEMNSCADLAAKKGKFDELKLARMKSFNEQESFHNIVEIIIQVYEQQFGKILEVFKSLEESPEIPNSSNNEDDFVFPMDSKTIQKTLKKTIQLKLNNLLSALNKNIIAQYNMGDPFFNYHTLWVIIISQLKYADYKNTRLIFALLEYFCQVEKDNLKHFYEKITSSDLEKSNYSNSLLLDYLFNIAKFKDLTSSFFLFWKKNINEDEVVSYVCNKITNESAFNMLDVFHCSLSNLRYFKKVIINTSLGLEFKEVSGYQSISQDMDLLIKRGYSLFELDSSNKSESNNSLKNDKKKGKKYDEWNVEGTSNSDSDSNESDEDCNDSSSSRNNKASNEIFHLNTYNIPLKRNQAVILNEIEGMRPNCLNVNENEIINIEEECIVFDVNLIKKCIEYLSEMMLTNNRISINLMINYLRIIKCLTRASEQSNESKELIRHFLEEYSVDIQRYINYKGNQVNFSVLSEPKVEAYFNYLTELLSDEEKNIVHPDIFAKNAEKKEKCKGYFDKNSKVISIFFNDSIKNKINIPLIDCSELDSTDYSEKTVFDVFVLDMEEFGKMKDYYEQIKITELEEVNEDEIILDEIEREEIERAKEESLKEFEKNKEIMSEKIEAVSTNPIGQDDEVIGQNASLDLKGTDKDMDKDTSKDKGNANSNYNNQQVKSDENNKNVEIEKQEKDCKDKSRNEELNKDIEDKKKNINAPNKKSKKPLMKNCIIILSDEVINHLGMNEKSEICREKNFIKKEKVKDSEHIEQCKEEPDKDNEEINKDKEKEEPPKDNEESKKEEPDKDNKESNKEESDKENEESNKEKDNEKPDKENEESNKEERNKEKGKEEPDKDNKESNKEEPNKENVESNKEKDNEEPDKNNEESNKEKGKEESDKENEEPDKDNEESNKEKEKEDENEDENEDEDEDEDEEDDSKDFSEIIENENEDSQSVKSIEELHKRKNELLVRIKKLKKKAEKEKETIKSDLLFNIFNLDDDIPKDKKSEKKSKPKKKSSSKSNSNVSDFTTSSWGLFTKVILRQYELSSCLFLIGSSYYNKIPKKFHSFSYSLNYLPLESLTSTSFHDYLKAKLSGKYNDADTNPFIKDIQTKIKDKTQIKLNNLYSQLNELSKEEKSKEKKQKEDKKTKLIPIENRLITPGNTFKDLYQCFPTFSMLPKKHFLSYIKPIAFTLIKYYLIHLQLVNSKLTNIESFQYMFYSAYYYKECFNLRDDYDKMIKLLPNIIPGIHLKSFLEGKNIVSLGYLSSNEQFDKIILDEFLLEIIRFFGGQKDNNNLTLILTYITQKGENYLEQDNSEGTILLFKIIKEIFRFIGDETSISIFIHSVFIQSLQENVAKHSKNDKQYYYIKIFEFLYRIMQLLIENKLIREDDKDAYYNSKEFKNIHMHYDIISNKFSSKSLVNTLLEDDPEYKDKMKTVLMLPAELSTYAIKLNNFHSSIMFNNEDQKESFIYMGVECPDEKIIKYPSTNIIKENLMKDSLIIKQNTSGHLRSVLYRIKKKQMKKQDHSLRQGSKEEILFSDLYQLNENVIVGKDDQGKFYFCGKYNKSTKTKQNMFLPFDEINIIAQQCKEITQIEYSLIITDQGVYYLKNHQDNCPKWMEQSNLSMLKFPLQCEHTFIGGHFSHQRLLLWTKDGKLFGIGKNDSSELSINSNEEITQLKEIDKPVDIHVLCAYSFDSSILIFGLNTKTGVKNIYVSGYCSQIFDSISNDSNWFAEVSEYGNEEIIKVVKYKGKLAILTEENIYTIFCEDDYDHHLGKLSYFKEKDYEVEDVWFSGDYPIFKVKSKKNGNQCYFIVKTKDEDPKLIISLDPENEKEINLNVRLFVIMNKKIIIANQLPFAIPTGKYFYGEDLTKKGTMKFRLHNQDGTKNGKNNQCLAVLHNSVDEDGIYVFNIIHNVKDQMIEEDEEIITTSSSKNRDPQLKEGDWQITDESPNEFPLSKDIMNQLLFFSQSIKHISQITLFLLLTVNKTPSSMFPLNYINLSLFNLIDLNNINTLSIKEDIKDVIKSLHSKLIQRLTDLKPSLIVEYIKSKDFYSNHSKEIKTTFIDYLKSKYSNYGQFHQLSSEVLIDQLELIVKQFAYSIKVLMKNVNCLFDSFFSTLVLSNLSFIQIFEQTYIINSFFEPLPRNHSTKSIKISRGKALKNISQGLKDMNYTWSHFCQMCDQMKKCGPSYYFKKRENVLMEVEFIGEFGSDAGGPGRELIDLVFSDLSSDYLDLFIPTPNNITKSGNDRDKYTINPKCTSSRCLELYTFLGKLLIYIISSECYVPLPLPSFIWKQILTIPLSPIDIEGIDVHSYNSIIKVLQTGSNEEKESLYEVLDFTCQLSNGKIVELVPNAESVKVNESNAELFLSLYLRARYNECHEQIQAIRNGLLSGIPQNILKCLSSEKLEDMICGEVEFDMELLKKNTIYDYPYNKEDKTIVNFWRFLEECTLEEKYLYIKFIWGRTRLPKSFEASDKHRISKMDVSHDEINKKLPISHTCFFHLELPPYTTFNILKEKLLYAMKNAMVISDSQSDLTFLS